MIKLEDLFNIDYPRTLIFSEQEQDPKGINFISSRGTNNGIVARVKNNSEAVLYPSGCITVPLKGTVLHAFLQPEQCYVAHQIAVLTPKTEMSDQVKIFYCLAIRKNKYRYNYGRQADRTLRQILVPSPNEIPKWVYTLDISNYTDIKKASINNFSEDLNSRLWEWFSFSDLFEIKKGKRLTKADMEPGQTPFIGATDSNNGLTNMINKKPIHPGNVITVNYNGNGVAEAYYQPTPFWCSDDVNVLYPNFTLDAPIAMFICTIIRKEKYRFNYGRKWHVERMKSSKLKLPVSSINEPDWEFIRNYIKSLPYSNQIYNFDGNTH
ncbi:restriction endonuclease subunit S [Caldalkalibacillus mannanilyticus]|uniref:restriction endonuclease subunit S n=1 Tax=Caldalkalibacillus mannanilyticus TaxID=1418 RepID=UPI0004699EAB|nr:restriction endonuclease subunit S [Caldalkalibacillus mannanilyticus]